MTTFQNFLNQITSIRFDASIIVICDKKGNYHRYSPDKFWGEIYPRCVSKLQQAQEAEAGTLEQA
jgi:hypothetical protein